MLDALDRAEIESRFGVIVREIYMATEGLFGVACPHGTVHLCEDCVAFEWEPVVDLSSPLITDFTRRTQIMIRYRMNDLLRLSSSPCPCGSSLQAVTEIVGRCDDALVFSGPITVTPDIIRNAIVGSARTITDFRVIQSGRGAVSLTLPPHLAADLPAAQAALETLFVRLGAAATVHAVTAPLAPPQGGKLRRVIRERGGQA